MYYYHINYAPDCSRQFNLFILARLSGPERTNSFQPWKVMCGEFSGTSSFLKNHKDNRDSKTWQVGTMIGNQIPMNFHVENGWKGLKTKMFVKMMRFVKWDNLKEFVRFQFLQSQNWLKHVIKKWERSQSMNHDC